MARAKAIVTAGLVSMALGFAWTTRDTATSSYWIVVGQMFFDTRTEAEVRTFGVEQHATEPGMVAIVEERAMERRDHRGVDEIRLGPRQTQTQQRAIALEPGLD